MFSITVATSYVPSTIHLLNFTILLLDHSEILLLNESENHQRHFHVIRCVIEHSQASEDKLIRQNNLTFIKSSDRHKRFNKNVSS